MRSLEKKTYWGRDNNQKGLYQQGCLKSQWRRQQVQFQGVETCLQLSKEKPLWKKWFCMYFLPTPSMVYFSPWHLHSGVWVCSPDIDISTTFSISSLEMFPPQKLFRGYKSYRIIAWAGCGVLEERSNFIRLYESWVVEVMKKVSIMPLA